jgi:hypothetical protein
MYLKLRTDNLGEKAVITNSLISILNETPSLDTSKESIFKVRFLGNKHLQVIGWICNYYNAIVEISEFI